LVVRAGNEATGLQAGLIEWVGRLDIDGRADRAGGQGEIGTLQDVELAHELRAEGREIELLAVSGGNRTAFDEHLIKLSAEAADRDTRRIGSGRGRAVSSVDRSTVNCDT